MPPVRAFNLLLAAAVVALAAVVFWPRNNPTSTTPPAAPLEALAPAAIDHLRVRKNDDAVELVRRAGRWRLTEPVSAAADEAHLEVLLGLAKQKPLRRLDPAIPDRVTGLGPQAIVVTYNDKPPLRIGKPGPMPGSYYVATARGRFLVTIPHLAPLNWQWTDWLDHALVPPGKALSRLELPDFTLGPDDAGHWQVAAGDSRSADAARQTVAAWARAAALAVVPADKGRAPQSKITLYFEDGSQRVFDVIEDRPNLVLRDPALGADYHLAGNRIAPLLKLRHPGLYSR